MKTELDTNNTSADANQSRLPQVFFLIVLLIFVGARVWRLTATCLWFDEVFSIHAAQNTWPELIRFVAADIIHPPLFYLLLKAWIALGGESLLWLRLLPLTFATATIAPFYFLCRELNLKPAETNMAFLFMAISGFLIKYAQEVRMYSLLLFLSVTSIWLLIRYLRRDGSLNSLLVLAACNLLLIYAHYYGWLLIVAQAFVALLWYRRKLASFLLMCAALLLSYVPWIYAVLNFRESGKGLSQNIGWIFRPRPGDIGEYFVLLTKPFLYSQSTLDRANGYVLGCLILLLVGIAIGFLIFRRWRGGRFADPKRVIIVLAFVPVILAALLSWLLPYSVWGSRHLIICAVPFFVLAGLAVARLGPPSLKAAVFITFGCIVTLAGAIYLLKPAPRFSWCAWNDLVSQIPTNPDRSAPMIYTFEDLVAYHLWFAGTQSTNRPITVTVVKGLPGVPDDPAYFLPRRFDNVVVIGPTGIQGQHIWIAFRARRWNEQAPPVSDLRALEYELGNVMSMPAQGEQAFLVELWRKQ